MNKKLLAMIVLGSLLLVGCSNSNEEVKEIPQIPNEEVIENATVNNKDEIKKTEEEKKEDVVESKKDEPTEPVKDNQSDKKKDDPVKKPIEQEKPKKDVSKPSTQPEEKPTVPPVVDKPDEVVPPEPPKEEVVETPVKQETMANEVMKKINNYRIENGLQPLESTKYYQDKADAHALDMATERALWHSDNGECITNYPDPFEAWINSPEHREIILRENNTKGVVSVYYVDGYYYSVFKTAW